MISIDSRCRTARNLSRARRQPFGAEHLEPRTLLAAGTLDPSFGSNGRATADFGVGVTATAAVVQGDGKTVVVGSSADKRFAVARYNVDGSLDTTFGPTFNGTALTSFGHPTFAHAVALQDDGKIIVGGGNGGFDDDGVDVARYNADGTLDVTFDGDGRKNFEFGHFDLYAVATAIVVLPRQSLDAPQRILIGGSVDSGSLFEDFNYDFFVARLNGSDGSLDDSFGDSDGHHIIGLGAEDHLNAMKVDFTGSPETNPHYGAIVCAGTKSEESGSFSEFAVLRLTPGGSVDTTFDGDGSALVTMAPGVKTSGKGLVIQPDGKYVVGGTAGDDFAMARFLPTGPLDTSFGGLGTGWVQTEMGGVDVGTDLTRSYDGSLILGGTSLTGQIGSPGTETNAFAAYTADGGTDLRFGTNGRWKTTFGGGGRFANGPGRRFVFAGGGGMHAARFLDVGSNLVYAASLDTLAAEAGPNVASFFVYRSERLPYATRVIYRATGTATSPLGQIGPARNLDYTGITRANDGTTVAAIEIPAYETYVVVTITPRNDTLVEGNETATFTVINNPEYEVGSPSAVTITIVDDDAPPPSVAHVYARGSTWAGPDTDPQNVTFKESLAAAGIGDSTYGFRVDGLAADATLPWVNVNQLVLRYSSAPVGAGVPTAGGTTVHGVRSDYVVTAVTALDPQTFVLGLDRPLGNLPAAAGGGNNGDRVTLTVAGGGPSGSSYALALAVLQGDAYRTATARVTAQDLAAVKARVNRTSSDPPGTGARYSAFVDLNGDGRINAQDLAAVKARLNDGMPAALSPPQAAATLLFGSRRVRSSDLLVPADGLE